MKFFTILTLLVSSITLFGCLEPERDWNALIIACDNDWDCDKGESCVVLDEMIGKQCVVVKKIE